MLSQSRTKLAKPDAVWHSNKKEADAKPALRRPGTLKTA
jgi:hypothetical protein